MGKLIRREKMMSGGKLETDASVAPCDMDNTAVSDPAIDCEPKAWQARSPMLLQPLEKSNKYGRLEGSSRWNPRDLVDCRSRGDLPGVSLRHAIAYAGRMDEIQRAAS